MDFPSFGDAAGFDHAGASCASAVASGGDIFTDCYSEIRPLGIVFFYAVPHLATDDPVNRSYIVLMLNLLLFSGTFLGLRKFVSSDGSVNRRIGGMTPSVLSAVIFFPLLANLVGHMPVTLSDLPSLAVFMAAIAESANILFRENTERQLARRYFVVGFFVAVAVLLKQSYIVFGLFLVFSVLFFDKNKPFAFKHKVKCLLMFSLGMAPVLIQFVYVYLHSGHFWLYEPETLRPFAHAPKKPNIEAIAFNLPSQGAFMVQVVNDISDLTFYVFKLFRGIFGFEWAIYIGRVSGAGQFLTLKGFDFVRAYLLVAFYVAFTLFNIFRAPTSLKFFNLNGILISFFVVLKWHTELRYYLFPRIVFYMSILFWLNYALKTYGFGKGPVRSKK